MRGPLGVNPKTRPAEGCGPKVLVGQGSRSADQDSNPRVGQSLRGSDTIYGRRLAFFPRSARGLVGWQVTLVAGVSVWQTTSPYPVGQPRGQPCFGSLPERWTGKGFGWPGFRSDRSASARGTPTGRGLRAKCSGWPKVKTRISRPA